MEMKVDMKRFFLFDSLHGLLIRKSIIANGLTQIIFVRLRENSLSAFLVKKLDKSCDLAHQNK